MHINVNVFLEPDPNHIFDDNFYKCIVLKDHNTWVYAEFGDIQSLDIFMNALREFDPELRITGDY